MPIPARAIWLASQAREKGWKLGVELGVKSGRTTFHLLRQCPDLSMIAIDLWAPLEGEPQHGYHDWPHEKHKARFMERAQEFKGRLLVVQGLSWDVPKFVGDRTVDFVYIDACHSAAAVVKDVNAWASKVKPGGMLAGHDANQPGVKAALAELSLKWKPAPDRSWMVERSGA